MNYIRMTGLVVAVGLAIGVARANADDQRAGSVSGVVTKDGKPVAHARISLRAAPVKTKGVSKQPAKHGSPTTRPKEQSRKRDISGKGFTDADGKFTLENVAPGEYLVMAGEKGQGKGKVHVSVGSGETASVSIDLQPPKDKLKKANKLGL